jgi:hypothetical protein
MLDRTGLAKCHDDHAAAAAAVSKDSTAVALDTTTGHSCYFSFTLVDPPRVSYLNLHWPEPLAKSVFPAKPVFPTRPYVLAADKNTLLLSIGPHCKQESSDLFVYTAGSPSYALRLPAFVDPDVRGRSLCTFSLGILRLEDDRYIVSDLIVPAKRKVIRRTNCNYPIWAKLRVYSSKTGNWKIIERPIPQLHGQSNAQFPNLWSTDTVLPFDGHFLCWVDYFSGVLLADFSKNHSSALRYVPFPGKEYPDRVRVGRLCPGRFRRVSISRGAMRFVHVDNEWQETTQIDYDWDYVEGPERKEEPPRRGSKITIWTLNMVDGGGDFKFAWEVHRVIILDSLWAQPSYQAEHMPQRLPEFPLVSVDDPGVLCCLVREATYIGKAWMIMVDMKYAHLRTCTPYMNETFCSAAGTVLTIFNDQPLLPTVFSRGLKMPAGN